MDVLDPCELVQDCALPEWIRSWLEFFLLFIVEFKWFDLFIKVLKSLYLNLWQLVHVFITAMVSLLSRVFNGLLESVSQCLLIWHINSKHWEILVKGFYSLYLETFLLELVFFFVIEATISVIQTLTQFCDVFASLF